MITKHGSSEAQLLDAGQHALVFERHLDIILAEVLGPLEAPVCGIIKKHGLSEAQVFNAG